jgi:Ca2+/H+ antiporter
MLLCILMHVCMYVYTHFMHVQTHTHTQTHAHTHTQALKDREGGRTAKPGSLVIESIHITRIPTFLGKIGCRICTKSHYIE